MCFALHKNHNVFVNEKTSYNLTKLNDKEDDFNDIIEMNFDEI